MYCMYSELTTFMNNEQFVIILWVVQVNLCQKLLFLHQITHNMTTDCSLFMKIVSSEYLQNMLHTKSFWNNIIQWTSHDDLTEKIVLDLDSMEAAFFVKSLSAELIFFPFDDFFSSVWTEFDTNLQIDLEAKRMDGSS